DVHREPGLARSSCASRCLVRLHRAGRASAGLALAAESRTERGMSELSVPIRGAEMAVTRLDGPQNAAHSLVWAHGWGQSGQAFLGLAQSFSRMYPSMIVDFPGFRRSKPPPGSWGTTDYANAGAMRGILVKVIQEDLTQVVSAVACPTLLLYGKQDTERPPEIGERLARLINGADLVVLDGYDHLDILSRGQHQVATQIRKFLDRLA